MIRNEVLCIKPRVPEGEKHSTPETHTRKHGKYFPCFLELCSADQLKGKGHSFAVNSQGNYLLYSFLPGNVRLRSCKATLPVEKVIRAPL